MSFDQKCPGYSELGDILFEEIYKNLIYILPSYANLWILHLTRGLSDTRQLVFCDYMHNNLVGENAHPFLIVSLQANICNTSYDQKSHHHMEVFFFAVKLKFYKAFIW